MAGRTVLKSLPPPKDFCLDVMLALNKQRLEGVLCDVTLIVEETSFHAHKSVLAAKSPYFHKLFTSEMAEKAQEMIKFELSSLGLSKSVMGDMLCYLYTGNLNVLASQAQDFLIAADYFLLSELKDAAINVLESMINQENCCILLDLGERFSSDHLANSARMFIENVFSDFRHTTEFQELTLRQFQEIISSDNLVVTDEKEVFEAILAWVSHCEDKRNIYFEQLFSKIRLNSLDNEFLQFRVLGDKFVAKSTKCVSRIKKVFRARLEAKPYDIPLEIPRKCLQPPVDIVLTCGGMTPRRPAHAHMLRCYVPGGQWYDLPPMPCKRNWHGVASYSNAFYVIGGEKDGEPSASCDRFDLPSRTWREMSPLLRGVVIPAVAVLKEFIYVIGGVRNYRARLQIFSTKTNMWAYGESLSVAREITCAVAKAPYLYAIGGLRSDLGAYMCSVEKYDPARDSWSGVSDMLHARAGAVGLALNDKLYVLGGESEVRVALTSCERYDIDLDEWSSIARMGVPRYFAGVAAIGDGFYVFGGVGGSNVDCDEKDVVEFYDVSEKKWTRTLRMPWGERFFRICREQACNLATGGR
ncbi:predicted protein [Nematostella vectensis]|uniref:BTB domain-containing protein n=1 Tax=Nematostella vectensis TaxID=45351 RepID=A7SAR8_NEMVE|nr:predicted protein [Nematostella vectensis]|eukprot:XP_001631232.1 predicted protein [Nematostella vectensis]